MSHDLGDVVPLSITIVDASGLPANAGSVSVTVTLPDGATTIVGPVSPASTGVYHYDYVTVQAGRHGVRWVATGVNASAFSDAFLVEPGDPEAFVSVADLKAHMKKSGTADDEELRGFVAAACRMIRDRIGEVVPVTAVEEVTCWQDVIVLRRRPVITITSVQRLPGLLAIAQGDRATGVHGWLLDNPGTAVLMHTSRFPGAVRITYRAGRTPLPPNFRLAALELATHLWQNRKHNSGGGRPGLSQDQPVMPGSAFALPIRVRELLGLGRDLPRDEALVG